MCAITFQDWKPGAVSASAPSGDASSLSLEVCKQGDLVRSLKASKADKVKVDEAVKVLLELKSKYKAATGQVSTESMTPYGIGYSAAVRWFDSHPEFCPCVVSSILFLSFKILRW